MGKALFLTIIKEDRLDIIVGNRSMYVQSFYRLKGDLGSQAEERFYLGS